MDTQTQIDRLIELAIVQRSELKQLVEQLPQLREYLGTEIEKTFEQVEPQLRTELEEFCNKKTEEYVEALRGDVSEQIGEILKTLEVSAAAKYSALMAERERNIELEKQAEEKIAQHAASLPSAVKGIVEAELARFPRAGEIDQLRKEFAEPRGLNPRGKWQSGETYNKLDLVAFNGDSFVSNIDGNTEKPNRGSAVWTLSAARGVSGGGGGATSLTDLVPVPSNGQLLIGNGSAFVNNTLTAGTGVTITNGAGTITIDATGAQETLTATVKNAESVAITRGQVVYLYSATGGFASVKLAYNTSDATSAKTFGVVSDASIAPNGTGTVTCVGVVDKLNLGAYNDGDTVYLGATAGTITTTKPYAPNHLVYVGIIQRANAGNGQLYVRVQNGYELDEIHDVQIITPPAAGAVLVRDATNSLWKAAQIAGTANQVTVTNADAAVTLSLPTAVTNVNSLTAQSATNLTLNGGSSGASLVLGQGTNGSLTLTPNGTGQVNFNRWVAARTTAPSSLAATSGSISFVTNGSVAGTQDTWVFDTGYTDQSYRFKVGGTDRMVIAANTGNLLLGSTVDGGQKLQVAGSAKATQFLTGSEGITSGVSSAFAASAANVTTTDILSFGASARSGLLRGYHDGGGTVLWQFGRYAGGSFDSWFEIVGYSSSSGQAKVLGTTASTSTTTGALVVSGGVGVAGAVNAGSFVANPLHTAAQKLEVQVPHAVSTENYLRVSSNTGGANTYGAEYGYGLTSGGTPEIRINRVHAGTITNVVRIPTSSGDVTLAGNLTVSGGTATISAASAQATLNLTSSGGSGRQYQLFSDATGQAGIFDATGSTFPLLITTTTLSTARNLTVSGTGGISIGSATFTGGRALTATTGSGNNVSLRLLQTSVADWEVQNVATTGALAFSQSGSALSTLTATGNLLLGTTTDSGNGKLQLATHTTSAGGIGFGTDTSLYRISAGRVVIDHLGGSLPLLALRENGSSTLEIYTTSGVGVINTKTAKDLQFNTNNTLALTLDSSQRCILAGALRLNNAYTAGAPTATGYVTIQDSAGNTYKVLVGT